MRVQALDYLHCHKVVHGDLKPENVLMAATSDVKLSDFGCSKVCVCTPLVVLGAGLVPGALSINIGGMLW